jgi:hypothetical protein
MKTLKFNSALMGEYKALKEKHPEALILLRVNDFYEAFEEDAITISKILGIILAKRDDKTAVTGFPAHSLDTYLPKLVRSGHRVAICDNLKEQIPLSKDTLNRIQAGIKKFNIGETDPLITMVKEDNPDEYMTSEWETIATSRMKEINRLRALISAGKGHNATFIEEIGTEQTGGGVMVDFVNFKTLPYVIGITDDSVVVYRNRASFCGDEADVIGSIALEESREEYYSNLKKAEYLDKVMLDMEKLLSSFERLNRTWQKDNDFDLNLNEYLEPSYPFKRSFDDETIAVHVWMEEGFKLLVRKKKELLPNLADRNNLGEPEIKYKTVRVDVVEKTTLSVLVEIPASLEPEDFRDQISARAINWDSFEKDGDREMDNTVTEESNSKDVIYPLDRFFERYFPTVEEPSAPYFTKAEAEGKWIMAFDTIMQGWSCTTDGEDKPYLYNSKEEVEADDMFNPDEDFAILATEYLEGRKLIFGGKGARTEGVSIVKAE